MELLYRFEGKVGETTTIGLTSAGLRIDIPFEGECTGGLLAGGRGWGMDYLLQRPDGVGVADARDIFEIPGGHLHSNATGYILPPDGFEMPSIEQMMADDFEAPDVRLLIVSFALLETGVPEFAHLNRALIRGDGWVNQATGELVLEGHLVEPAPVGD